MGNFLAIPDCTAAWRICRETTGRPGEIKGPDKQPIRFPLDTTSEELVELCGPGVYRVYGLDEVGKQLAHVSTWDLTPAGRELRNVAPESPLAALRPNASAGSATDLRFALEAMTQMMRTNSDALRIVSESHVDLAKAMATVKGIPRNLAALQLTPAQAADDSDDDGDDDTEDRPRHWVELLMPFAQKAAEIAPAFVMGKVAQGIHGGQNTTKAHGAGIAVNDDVGLANRPNWEVRDLLDLRYASRKAQAKRAAREEQQTEPNAALAALQARIVADPALVQHMLAIKGALMPEEITSLLGAIAHTSEEERTKVIHDLKSLPVEGAVEYCRELVKAIRGQ